MDIVDIGYVAKPHGVRGELRVVPYNPESVILTQVERVLVGGKPYEVIAARPARGAFLMRLLGVDDRDQAELLRGLVVSVARDLIALDEGEILLSDLIGCEAVLPDGTSWGTIVAIEMGPQDRLVIQAGQIERLLPMVNEFVIDVDLDTSRVVVSPPEGLPEARISTPRSDKGERQGP